MCTSHVVSSIVPLSICVITESDSKDLVPGTLCVMSGDDIWISNTMFIDQYDIAKLGMWKSNQTLANTLFLVLASIGDLRCILTVEGIFWTINTEVEHITSIR